VLVVGGYCEVEFGDGECCGVYCDVLVWFYGGYERVVYCCFIDCCVVDC